MQFAVIRPGAARQLFVGLDLPAESGKGFTLRQERRQALEPGNRLNIIGIGDAAARQFHPAGDMPEHRRIIDRFQAGAPDRLRQPFRHDFDAVRVPEIRFADAMPHQIPRRLAPGGADLINHMEIFAIFLFQPFTRGPGEVGRHFVSRLHDLRRTRGIQQHAGRRAVGAAGKKHIDAGILPRLHADKIAPRGIAVHFGGSIRVHGAAAMPGPGESKRPRHAARTAVPPRPDHIVRDDRRDPIAVFVAGIGVFQFRQPLPEQPGSGRRGPVVGMDSVQEQLFDLNFRFARLDRPADLLLKLRRGIHQVQRNHHRLFTAGGKNHGHGFQPRMDSGRQPPVILPGQFNLLIRRRSNVRLAPADLECRIHLSPRTSTHRPEAADSLIRSIRY